MVIGNLGLNVPFGIKAPLGRISVFRRIPIGNRYLTGGCRGFGSEGGEASKAKAKRKRKYAELIAHAVEVPAWLNAGEEEEEDGDGEGDNVEGRVGESRRGVSWIWMGAGMTGTDTELEDALRIEWAKAYARARRWKEEVRLLTEEFRRLPISLEFEADLWRERASAVQKQEVLFRDIAAWARQTETATKVARGKRGPREVIIDPLAPLSQQVGTGEATEEGDNDDDDDGLVAGEEPDGERGVIESDEELVMGGEAGGKVLPTAGRPKAVHWWISRARKTSNIPAGIDGDDDERKDFYAEVTSWWIKVNPAWRKEGVAGVEDWEAHRLKREDGGDLNALPAA
ncbi:hypothetical protein B0H14DRAFT_3514759 [Mycena olivaceomarginata]|nr:hypothetical protein B0H14DRAFT_3514759 [Mycena olivaceomarginata]